MLSLSAHAADHAVILQYHHFSNTTPASTSVTPDQFDAHLDYLEQNGFTVWPLEKVVEYVANRKPLPDKTVAITVDDAYDSIYSAAWPRIKQRGWSMTVFVNTDAVDQGLRPYLNWNQIREMAKGGVTFANHSASHDHLIRRSVGESEWQWRERVEADIEKAQQRLNHELDTTPKLFVYPYGEYDAPLRQLVGDLGYIGFGQQSGPMGPLSDLRTLPRFPMAASYAKMGSFIEKIQTLPLPVTGQGAVDPLLPMNIEKPRLLLNLENGPYNQEQITCFITGQGRGKSHFENGVLTVQAEKPLPVGRSRYNCTVRHQQKNRYYWYSQTWIKRKGDGSWYRE